jgi:hypothetical protein
LMRYLGRSMAHMNPNSICVRDVAW